MDNTKQTRQKGKPSSDPDLPLIITAEDRRKYARLQSQLRSPTGLETEPFPGPLYPIISPITVHATSRVLPTPDTSLLHTQTEDSIFSSTLRQPP